MTEQQQPGVAELLADHVRVDVANLVEDEKPTREWYAECLELAEANDPEWWETYGADADQTDPEEADLEDLLATEYGLETESVRSYVEGWQAAFKAELVKVCKAALQ